MAAVGGGVVVVVVVVVGLGKRLLGHWSFLKNRKKD
jgi:hypothetical protein